MTLPPLEPTPSSSKKSAWRALNWVLTVALLAGLATPPVIIASAFAPGPLREGKTVVVSFGSSAQEIGASLKQEGAVYAGLLFRIGAKIAGPLKAGEYAVPAKASAFDIAMMLHEGRSVVRTFTAAEGLTSAEIVGLLNAEPALTGEIAAIPPEGSLLPETYRYSYRDSRASLIARMQKAMQEKVNELWAGRDAGILVQSAREAVTLASIVEKETGKAEERAKIAGVFYNRIRQNMRLQSDPTVIYALTGGRGPLARALTHDDLSVPSPINTYASDGIPPQPICNPGRAAIEATLHPERHAYIYFVADGTGGHVFASDLATHNKNINAWHAKIRKAASEP
jgi:UPF0755 protein